MIRIYPILFLGFVLTLSGCQTKTTAQESRFMMNTIVTIKLPISSQKDVRSIIDRSFLKIKETTGIMNRYDKDSECAFINRLKSADKIKLSPQMSLVLKKALELNIMTKGAFDVTVSPLVDLWGFNRKEKKNKIPSPEEIESALLKVSSSNILLDEEEGSLSFSGDGIKIDLSGIAKGYAVDNAVKVLKDSGIEDGLVDAGGDIYCLGQGPNKNGWQVGIRHPREERLLGRIVLKDKAVATSGDYQKFFIVGKKRYSHIIDPRNGYPVSDTPMSVTVVASDCITADGLATGIFVLGPVDGLRLAEELDGVEAIVVSQDRKDLRVDVTSGLKKNYESF